MAHAETMPANFDIDKAFGTLVMWISALAFVDVFLGIDS